MDNAAGEPIAVVGVAARLPGARDVAEFWRNLVDDRESVTFWDRASLRAAGVDEAATADPDYVPAAPVMPGADRFDRGLFGMTRREAELCDPQLRTFLEISHQALEDAGYDPFAMPDSVGVFGSAGPAEYLAHCLRRRPDLLGPAGMLAQTLNQPDYLATLVSYKLDLRGPAMTVLTACSSTLVAVHIACQALRLGECDTAVAGGAVVRVPAGHGYKWTPGSVLSRDGHCRPFDVDATGTVFGSGAGAVVLKRLDDAYVDGDDIRAVVLGSAVNNDGAGKVSFSAPSVAGQAAVVTEAMALAGVAPDEVGYVEAHATGTALGDPIEVAALAEAYRELSERPLPAGGCVLGAVKSNIGHLDAAAGIAGFLKVVLALEREAIPATVHLRRPNPRLALESTPFTLADRLRPWPRDPGRRRVAGVTSLGIGGTNAHVVLAEGPPLVPAPPDRRDRVVVWSAGSPTGERRLRGELAGFFAGPGADRFTDAVATLQHGRTGHRTRAAVVCASASAAVAALAGAPGAAPVLTGEAGECPVAFRVPGRPPGLPLAIGLYGTVREFTIPMDECLEQLERCGLPLYKRWTGEPASTELVDPRFGRPLLFAVAYALAAMWQRAGVQPVAVIGHGAGELAAAAIAGALPLPAAAKLLAEGSPVPALGPSRIPYHTGADALPDRQRPGVLLELGPVGRPAAGDTTVLASLGTGRDDRVDLLATAARLWVRGVPVDWTALDQPRPGRRVAMPGYPYERERYWADPPPASHVEHAPVTELRWREQPPPAPAGAPPATRTALVLMPDHPEDGQQLLAALRGAGLRPTTVRHGEQYAEREGAFLVRPGRLADLERVLDRLAAGGSTPDIAVHAATCAPADPAAILDDRLQTGFHSLLALSTLLLRGDRWPSRPALVVLTRHAVDVSGGEPVDPARAALLGLFRSALVEAPGLRGTALDVAGRVDPAGLAGELAADRWEPVVALRGRRRWLPAERPVPLPATGGTGLREHGVYLVTGGTGGLGLATAGGLAGTGRRPRIALLARRPDAVEVAALDRIREQGAEVVTYACDVTDGPALERVVAEVTARWGPVHGLFHLAGVPGGRMLAFRDPAGAAAVLAPKVAGTRQLERVFAGRPELDFAVFFSSRAATYGLVGGGDYAAANAYLDGAAAGSPLAGGRVLSIGWPVWRDAGMAARAVVDVDSLYQTVRRLATAGEPALVWERQLSDETDWTLDEHRLRSTPLLPGTAMVDLALRAFRETVNPPPDRPIEMSDVVFRAPLLDRSPRLVRITLRPVGERFDLRLASRPAGGGEWRTHATARIGALATGEPSPVDLPALRSRFELAGHPEPLPPEQQTITLGPRWRNVTGRWALGEERLLRIELPPAYHTDLAEHAVHPALLDTATAAVRGREHADTVPFHYRRLTVHAPLPARFHAHVHRDGREPAGDVKLVADDGALLVRVEGFTMVAADPQRLAEPGGESGPAGLAPGAAVDLLLRLIDAGVTGPVLVRPSAVGEPEAAGDATAAAGVTAAPAPPGNGSPAERLGELWRQTLGVDVADLDQDFFDAGGDSLSAVELTGRIREAFGVELGVGVLLRARTLGELVALLGDRTATGAGSAA